MNWILIAVMGVLVAIGFLIDKKRNPILTNNEKEIETINYED